VSDPPWLNEAQQRAWRAYLAMSAQLTAHLHRQLQAESGLSLADFEVLVCLTDRVDRRARVLELAADLQWEKSRLSHHLVRMHRRGLVTREECAEDARGSFVALTPHGLGAIEQAAPAHVATVRAMVFDQLDDAEVDTLAGIAQRVLVRLNQ